MKALIAKIKKTAERRRQPLVTTGLLAMILMSYQNCQQQEFYAKDNFSELSGNDLGPSSEVSTVIDSPSTTSPTSLCEDGKNSADLICNPLGGGANPTQPVGSKNGLIANLFEGSSEWNSLDKYFIDGYKHPENIFFSNFNISTRNFDQGFDLSNGDFLKNKNGLKLTEWFGIEAKGYIVLPESEEDGYFHIMTLSDDGIEVSVDGKSILENKYIHSPTFNCATSMIRLKKGEEHDFRLRYFQGPRTQIALVTLIKRVTGTEFEAAAILKPACPKVESIEAAGQRGYEVIKPEWFTLPDEF
ncbi:MAG: hypothetical protein K2Q18_10490 [Bdellovibrionales bacterium]|nr:hypothetical protein [Bdellovibrionales bacterium]